jgi:hypothetical protein
MAASSYTLDRYILSDHEPIPCEDLNTWTLWLETPQRLVQDTQLTDSAGDNIRICTAFLGVDVNFGEDRPILFETVVLGGRYDWELYRYGTWEEAEQGHAAVVERCQGTGVSEQIPAALFKARELAQHTLKKASQVAVISLIERYFRDYQPVK